MSERKVIQRGIRLTPTQHARLLAIAQLQGVSQNQAICRLIDSAARAQPAKINRHDAPTSTGPGIMAIAA